MRKKEPTVMPLIVYDHTHKPETLNEELARGGEGAVYPLARRENVLIKLYHPHKLANDGTQLQAKIEAMMQIKDRFKNSPICWPRISVFDADHQWLGYAMQRAEGVSMTQLAHACLYKKHFPQLNRNGLVKILLNYLDAIDVLHQHAIFVGDFNLNNAICHPQSYAVTLIDCDSVQFTRHNTVFPCLVGSPDLTPIEHHDRPFREISRNAQSDYFSLAIILFKCLMLGRHPYDIVGGTDPVSNMRQGNFPYGKGSRGLPPGHWYNIWSHMPYRLKDLFIRVFTEGTHQASARPTIAEWREALTVYLKEMDKGWHETAILPPKPKSSEHKGYINSVSKCSH